LSINGLNQTESFLTVDRSEQNVGTMGMDSSQLVRDKEFLVELSFELFELVLALVIG
jgi:hypothetical protein